MSGALVYKALRMFFFHILAFSQPSSCVRLLHPSRHQVSRFHWTNTIVCVYVQWGHVLFIYRLGKYLIICITHLTIGNVPLAPILLSVSVVPFLALLDRLICWFCSRKENIFSPYSDYSFNEALLYLRSPASVFAPHQPATTVYPY